MFMLSSSEGAVIKILHIVDYLVYGWEFIRES
jgi:hypothetical protein